MRRVAKFVSLLGVLIAITLVVLVFGQSNQATGSAMGTKLGIVDTRILLEQTEEGKRELAKLNQLVQERQKEYETKTAELQELNDQFTQQARTLNAESRSEMQRVIEERQLSLKRFQEDAQMETQKNEQEMLARIGSKVKTVLADYAQSNGYDLILQRDASQVFVSPALEITQDIVNLYNERYSVTESASRKEP